MTGKADVADKSRYRANMKDLDVSFYNALYDHSTCPLVHSYFSLQSDVSDQEESEKDVNEETKESKESKKTGIYKIPKLAAVPYSIYSISYHFVALRFSML